MSHFTVLVIGDNPEKQLAPFDENLEVDWIDKTEEYKKQYEEKIVKEFYCKSNSSWGMEITEKLFGFINSNSIGTTKQYVVTKLSPMSYFKLNGKYKGYHRVSSNKRSKKDAWFEVVEILETTHPNKETCFEGKIKIKSIAPPKEISFKDKYPEYNTYLNEWHGVDTDEEQRYHTNPKAKWDWYVLGGRWTGFFKLKKGVKGDIGKQGIMTEPPKKGRADALLLKDIDIVGMKKEVSDNARKMHSKAQKIFAGESFKHWDDMILKGDEAREFYNNQPPIKRFNNSEDFGIFDDADSYDVSEIDFKKQAEDRVLSPYAIVKDGKWYQKGEMGWWGMSSNEKDQSVWNLEVNKLIDELPQDTLLSMFDCHI